MDNLFDIKNEVVAVTGGLGQLGRQFSKVLLENGAKVAVLDKKIAHAPEKKNFLALECDITDKNSIKKALDNVSRKLGVPQGLINNAGLDSPPGSSSKTNGRPENYPESAWDQVMEVNLKGMFLCCQVFGAAMAKEKKGSIINISSIYGMVSPDQRIYGYRRKKGEDFYKPAAYSVSKSGVFNLTRYLATYWAKEGVRVNTLTFGGVFNDQDKEFLNSYADRVPIARMAREDEYNGAVIFLLSKASSYMTGSNLVIDGGWTAW